MSRAQVGGKTAEEPITPPTEVYTNQRNTTNNNDNQEDVNEDSIIDSPSLAVAENKRKLKSIVKLSAIQKRESSKNEKKGGQGQENSTNMMKVEDFHRVAEAGVITIHRPNLSQ